MRTYLDERRYDHLNRLVDDSEAVNVVQTQDVRSHEGEDGHDVVEDFLLEEDKEETQVSLNSNSSNLLLGWRWHSQGRWRRRSRAAAGRGGGSAACQTL